MDSLAAPQDRLVEQLLSPRTQAQRRLKVCVEGGVECGSECVRPRGRGLRGLRGCEEGLGAGAAGWVGGATQHSCL